MAKQKFSDNFDLSDPEETEGNENTTNENNVPIGAARYSRPAIESGVTTSATDDKSNKGVNETDNSVAKTKNEFRELYNEQLETPKSALDPNADKNIAKRGGQFGSLNGKKFEHTLNLMRKADAYNNKPTENIHRIGLHGVQDLGPAYNRPRIETEEMREMDRNRQLDLNQKQLAQALQAAVNRKDLDAFMYFYQQMFGVELTRNQAEIAMRQFLRQNQISNILTKDVNQFTQLFSRWLDEDTALYAFNLMQNGNTQLANMLSSIFFTGVVPPAYAEYLRELTYQAKMHEYMRKNPDATEQDVLNESSRINTRMDLEQQSLDQQEAYSIKYNQSGPNKQKNKKIGKANARS